MDAAVLGWSGLGLSGLVCLFATAGGRPERRAALAVALACGATFVAQAQVPRASAGWVLAPLDLAALWVLMRLTWRSGRAWPVFAVGAQALAPTLHLIRLLSPDLAAAVYLRALSVAHLGVLLALGVGAVRARWSRQAPPVAVEPAEIPDLHS